MMLLFFLARGTILTKLGVFNEVAKFRATASMRHSFPAIDIPSVTILLGSSDTEVPPHFFASRTRSIIFPD
jgi:hypothetical protein